MSEEKLTLKEGEFLVKLARKAVESYIKDARRISPPKDTPSRLWDKRGVFVTLEKLYKLDEKTVRELRGCIGRPYPLFPLVEATIDSAIDAAVNDPRFNPVSLSELTSIVVEVSVLTKPKLLEVDDPRQYPSLIKIGRDGLIVEHGPYKGLLLPQVPVEYKWDPETFLCECCIKAFLPPDSWLRKDVRIYTFQAQVFSELNPRGEVIERKLEEELNE